MEFSDDEPILNSKDGDGLPVDAAAADVSAAAADVGRLHSGLEQVSPGKQRQGLGLSGGLSPGGLLSMTKY